MAEMFNPPHPAPSGADAARRRTARVGADRHSSRRAAWRVARGLVARAERPRRGVA